MSKGLIKVPSKVIIDTGPLLLFLAGNHNPDLLPKVKLQRRTPQQSCGACKAPLPG
jgi:hypothetical protein